MSAPQSSTYRHLELVLAAFITVQVCSNLIGPAKITQASLPLVKG